MYRLPSRRKTRSQVKKPNLIPILDAVFIFIFFLLMSASFVQIFEISSDVPIVKKEEPNDNKNPLALTLEIESSRLDLRAGVPSKRVATFGKTGDGSYDLRALHNRLINIKKWNKDKNTIIFVPKVDLEYQDLVEIMDSVRLLYKTDEALFKKGNDGVEAKVKRLFDNIVFGNIQS